MIQSQACAALEFAIVSRFGPCRDFGRNFNLDTPDEDLEQNIRTLSRNIQVVSAGSYECIRKPSSGGDFASTYIAVM